MNLVRGLLTVTVLLILAGCGTRPAKDTAEPDSVFVPEWQMELRYAERFSVEYDREGRARITIDGGDRFLAVPEGVSVPAGLDVPVLKTPLETLYIASSSSMDHFRRLGALDAVRFTSTKAGDWALPEVRAAVEADEILYAGKYSAPDFEALLEEGVALAVENTMIYHAPEIKEQLEALGIPVLVDKCGYEPHPLGRMEWVKLYGLLIGKSEEAAAFFDEQTASVPETAADTGKTVCFFRITPGGYMSVRMPGDYVSRMIALSGGRYVPESAAEGESSAQSTMNMQVEAFYAAAKDADVLIYDAALGGLETLDELLEKSPLLADFRAVQTGNAWCTGQNLFQETCGAAGMLRDLYAVLSGDADGTDRLTYLHRLK